MDLDFCRGNGRVVLRRTQGIHWLFSFLTIVCFLWLGLAINGLELRFMFTLPTHSLLILALGTNGLGDVVVVASLKRWTHLVLKPHDHLLFICDVFHRLQGLGFADCLML